MPGGNGQIDGIGMLRIEDAGDDALIVYLAEKPGEQSLARVIAFSEQVRGRLKDCLLDVVPSYCSVALYFDVLKCDYYDLRRMLREIAAQTVSAPTSAAVTTEPTRTVTLPVYYDPEVAPDLLSVAAATGLTVAQVIECHSRQSYRVFALGFRPGFAFMGETPDALRLPRLDIPRRKVPAGAVAIAGAQATVYPSTSPGGWNLIGLCPQPLFSCADGNPQVLLAVGDQVRFKPVSREVFLREGGHLHE